MQTYLIGIGAGIGSALLFLAPIGGTPLAFPLFILTGLPIGIAGLGWGPAAGAAAAIAGTATIFAALSTVGAASYLLLFALPVFWLSRLALLSQLTGDHEPTRVWYPLGRMLMQLAGIVAVGVVLVGVVIGFDREALTGEVTAALLEFFSGSQSGAVPPTAAELEPFVRFQMAVMPFTVTAIMLFVLVFNLWLAAVVARASGRMERPREKMWTVILPNEVFIALAIAAVISFLPGGTGEAARVVAGALSAAAALTGLAVMHAVTTGMRTRTPILVAAYTLLVLSGLPLFLFALLAIAEAVLGLRNRRFKGVMPQ